MCYPFSKSSPENIAKPHDAQLPASSSILPIRPHPAIQTILESKNDGKAHDENGDGATHTPEISLRPLRVDDALQVHAEIRREEGQREEDDGDDGERQDGFVVRLGHHGDFVLLDGAELEKLEEEEEVVRTMLLALITSFPDKGVAYDVERRFEIIQFARELVVIPFDILQGPVNALSHSFAYEMLPFDFPALLI
jgi:hypothetical protein